MSEREVFCDRLDWRSAIALARSGARVVRVLDDVPSTAASGMLRGLLRLFGCEIVETAFFAGEMRGARGEPVYIVASRRSSEAAIDAARFVVERTPRLAAINARAGADRLVLRLARQFWHALGRQVLQIHLARGLAQGGGAILWLARPTRYSPVVLGGIDADIEVRCYTAVNPLAERARMAGWALALAAKGVYWRMASVLVPQRRPLKDVQGRPGVLLLQEDVVSADRSHRTQLHWFPDAGADRLPFATYLIAAGTSPVPRTQDAPHDLTLLTAGDLGYIDRRLPEDGVASRLRGDARRCARGAITARHDWARAGFAVAARLMLRARILAKTCRFLDVRAFLTGEPYLLDSDAMHAVGSEAGVTTLAFQYSNVAYSNVIAATTSDHMMVFSDRFERIWPYGGFRPKHFIPIGYPFDAAFDKVRARAAQCRRALESAGARFVIAYFDENAGPPKYGFMAPSELDDEIRMLAQRVVDDPGLGVIFKSQFRKRSPTVRLASDDLFEAAIATRRMIDLQAGSHRNIVLPAEAALASDIAISQTVGGTAALEAALTGTRCLLVNFNGLRTQNDELYARGLVVFDSFAGALEAIDGLRAGDPRYRSLGDWSAFIHELDPFRDGRAAERLRGTLEAVVTGEARAQAQVCEPREAHA